MLDHEIGFVYSVLILIEAKFAKIFFQVKIDFDSDG